MPKALESVLQAPSLKRIQPGGQEAIDLVNQLAAQQSNAPESAAQFTPLASPNTGVTCSLSLNPEAGTLSVLSSDLLNVDAEKLDGKFKITIHF